MSDLLRLRRAGGDALKVLVDLLPDDWDPRTGAEDVSLLFADICGYSAFVAEAGDDATMALLAALDRAVTVAVERTRGARVVKRLGDGVMLVSRRNTAALLAARVLVEDFAASAAAAGWPLALRVGIHRGTSRRRADDYFGYHVNVAARVADVAGPGQILATASALAGVDLAEAGLRPRPAGVLEAKGVSGPVDLFALVRTVHP